MNDVVRTQQSQMVLLKSRKNLNKGQEQLMKLISLKIKLNEKLSKSDIIPIYQNHVQRSKTYSIWAYTGEYYEYGSGENYERRQKTRSEEREYTKWDIENSSINWFVRSLGALIKKGYLTVIPVIDLAEAKQTD